MALNFHQFETSKVGHVHNSKIMSALQELKYLSEIEFEDSMPSCQDGESTSFVRLHVQNDSNPECESQLKPSSELRNYI
jgi:hypothetical protein